VYNVSGREVLGITTTWKAPLSGDTQDFFQPNWSQYRWRLVLIVYKC